MRGRGYCGFYILVFWVRDMFL
uniref:Uncharacterized protein n=1 Tax=Rhizophora mucronata TaxID=61149 RepID=A0A2P2NH52_RHIMU